MTTDTPQEVLKSNPTSFSTLTFSALQVVAIILFVATTLCGAGWFLYANGAFAPDTELTRQASYSNFSYEQSHRSNQELLQANRDLAVELERLRAGTDTVRLNAEARMLEQNTVVAIVKSCIEATTAGEDTEVVTRSENIAMANRPRAQDGAAILKRCVETYKEGFPTRPSVQEKPLK